MERIFAGLVALLLLGLTVPAQAYTLADLQTSGGTVETIPLEASVVVNPATINIRTYAPGTFSIYRKSENATTWGNAIATGIVLAAEGVWSDTSVVPGTLYEYKFVNTAGTPFNGIQPTGYILTGINIDKTLPKGRLALVVASDVPEKLPLEYAQYKGDLMRDGWVVHEIQCFRAADYGSTGVAAIKTIAISSGGTGYTNGAPVLLTAGTKKARGVATTSGGAITAVAISSGGAGFAVGETLALSGGGGSGFAATVTSVDLTHAAKTVSVIAGGSGYTDNDLVSITGATSGATAQGHAVAKTGAMTSVLAVLGPAFIAGESIVLAPANGGSGAIATVGAVKGAHVAIRENVQSIYQAHPGELKNVVIVGKVPVCRSGIDDGYGIDGHGIVTAYPTDAFYAEMTSPIGTGGWTDTANNASYKVALSPSTSGYLSGEQCNIEGDGKYDANKIFQVGGSGAVELGFGRIDFYTETVMETEALRNYFRKLHRYKTASPDFLPGRKACIRKGSFPNVTETGLQSMPNVGGMGNIEFVASSARPAVAGGEDSDQAYSALHGPYLFYFKEGGQPMAGEGGKAVFWTGFQSHWGYWWESGVMQRNLAEDSFTLSYTWSAWGTRFIYHRMGMGLDAGDMMKQSQNNNGFSSGSVYPYKYDNPYNYDHNGQLWMQHMGDPTLRLFMFEPASRLSIAIQSSSPVLSWVASPEPGVIGYHVYRKPQGNGPYTRLTVVPQAGTTYTDPTVTSGRYTYMVSAVKLETSGGGTFFNPSLGVEQSIDLTNVPPPVSVVTTSLPDANWNTAYSQTLVAEGGWPMYDWSIASGELPAGLSLSATGAITGVPSVSGSFTFTVQAVDRNNAVASKALSLTVGNNEKVVVYPEATSYVRQNSPAINYGTSELNYMTHNSGQPWEIFHRYDLSGLDLNHGFIKASLRIYLSPGTPAVPTDSPPYALVQGQLMADSADGWSETGNAAWFSGYSNNGSGKVRITSPGHGLANGSLVTIAGLTGSGAPTAGPYPVTYVDADQFDLATVTYLAGWAYDPAYSYATTTNITWNNRPTETNESVPVVNAGGPPVIDTFLELDVTPLVAETLASDPEKLMSVRLFTGTSQKLGFVSRRGYGDTKPRLVIESSDAPRISMTSPGTSPVSIYFGESVSFAAAVTAIPARADSLVVGWTKISGPGSVVFASPSAPSTDVSFGAAGDYVIRLTANDGVLQSWKDLTVRVLNSPVLGTTTNMTLRLPFDESSGTAAVDVSGGGNNGALGVGAAWTTGGRIGGALSLDGGSISKSIAGYSNNGSGKVRITCAGHGLQTGNQVTIAGFSSSAINGVRQVTVVDGDTFDTTVNYVAGWTLTSPTATVATSYVKVAHSATLDNTQKLTVSVWVRPTATDGTTRSVVAKTLGNTNGAYGIRMANGKVTATVSSSNITGNRTLPAGQWSHLVLVFDGELGAENTKLYIDGSPDIFGQLAQTSIPLRNTAPLWIGALNDASPNGFIGAIDDVRVYQGKALTLAEILDLYQGAAPNMGPRVEVTGPVAPTAGVDCSISGTVTDDGLPLVAALAWTQVSGPGTAVFSDATSATSTVRFPVAGTYVLRLTANDGVIASYAEWTGAVEGGAQQTLITTEPSSFSIPYNSTASLYVAATGYNLTYQWYRGASGNTADAVSGATSAHFTTPQLTSSTHYWVRVTGSGGTVDSATATVTVATAYASWSGVIADPAKRGPDDDADGDTIANFLEFAFGLDPNVGNSAGLPSGSINGANFEFTFHRARAELNYVVEACTNLAGDGWETVVTNPGNAGGYVTVLFPLDADTRKFVRLRVTE